MKFFQNLSKDQLQKMVLVGIGTLGVIIGTVQFYVLGQWRACFGAREEIKQLQTEIDGAQQRQRAATENQPAVKQLQQFVDGQQAAMVQGDAFAWAVREISLLAEKHPVRVLSLRHGGAGKPQAGKEAPTYSTRLEVAGAYDQLGKFVTDLENHFPTAEIRALEIAGNTSGPGTHQANIDLTFRVRAEPPSVKTAKKVAS